MEAVELVRKLRSGRVAVIGDVMLDHYVVGEVGRISPEAPVPVLHVAEERYVLGAAANVAANIAALGGAARLVGVIGADRAGQDITQRLAAFQRVETALHVCDTHPTILKTRYMAGQQQIVRVDRETLRPHEPHTIAALTDLIDAAARECSCLVLSDYGKGVLDEAVIAAAMAAAARHGATVIVDPKRRRLGDYRGAHYITPNRKELSDATGLPCEEDDEAQAAAGRAIEDSGAAILLTRSERGMSLFRPHAPPLHMATEAREVFDVSGAGDTVVATFALALAAGQPVETAMRAANAAAGVVVAKLGTAVCTTEELADALRRGAGREGHSPAERLGAVPLEEAAALRESWGQAGLSVGFANGCFDLIHPGHVALIREAAAACDRLIVAINSDASVRQLKGPARPLQTAEARAQVLAGLKGVDLVVVFEEPTPLEAVRRLQPDVIVKGSDYAEDEVVGGDIVKARGGRVLLVDLKAGHSTSSIVARAKP